MNLKTVLIFFLVIKTVFCVINGEPATIGSAPYKVSLKQAPCK